MTALQRSALVPRPDAAASVSSVICVILSAAVWPSAARMDGAFTVVATAPAADAAAVGAYASGNATGPRLCGQAAAAEAR
jgi:hypothetical protein